MIKSGATWTNAPVGEIRPVGLKPDLITGPPVGSPVAVRRRVGVRLPEGRPPIPLATAVEIHSVVCAEH
jgi:hypothetical protein